MKLSGLTGFLLTGFYCIKIAQAFNRLLILDSDCNLVVIVVKRQSGKLILRIMIRECVIFTGRQILQL